MNKTKNNMKNIAISTIFLLIIGGLLVVSFFSPHREFSDNENRSLGKMPKLSMENIADGKFSDGFESYVQDQFFGRDFFMSLKTSTDKNAGKKDNGSVYFGNNGYLFSIESIDYEQLEKNISYVNNFAEKIELYNGKEHSSGISQSKPNHINISAMVVPTATEILKSDLPKHSIVPDQSKAIEKIDKELHFQFINTIDTMKNKADQYIYYKTDHHWTTLGAKYAYEKWAGDYLGKQIGRYSVKTVCDDFLGTNYSKAILPFTEPDEIQRFDLSNGEGAARNETNFKMTVYNSKNEMIDEYKSMYDEKYLDKKDKYSYFLAGNNPITVIEKEKNQVQENTSNAGVRRNILVIKDSYAHAFIPFLTDDFDRIVAVDMRYCKENPTEFIEEYGITDVLIMYNILNFSNDKNLVYVAL